MLHSFKLSRRGLLQQGVVAWGSAAMSGWLSSLAFAAEAGGARKRSVILLWMEGGPATIDLWDLKPGHVHGGPFREIATTAPGLRISECLPRIAHWGDALAVIRSITSQEGDHNRATHYVKTGYNPQGAVQFPVLGALLAHELPAATEDLPCFVSVAPGDRTPAQLGGGFLGPRYFPLNVGKQGDAISDLAVANLHHPEAISEHQQAGRLRLLDQMEKQFSVERSGAFLESHQFSLKQAVRMMSAEARKVFDLEQEPQKLRDRYGWNLFGQGCLLARRLIERGVPCVEVTLGGWDAHSNNFELVKDLSTTLDVAWTALMEDLKNRGLLDSTLIVCMGEFGRTPKINSGAGRDHWPNVWSAVLTGGGIQGGGVVGSSSPDGLEVADRPITAPDLIATVCAAMDIPPQKQNMSNVGRPIRIADPSAAVIKELL